MWKYRGKWINSHDDLLPECTDIVYVIQFSNLKYYIGKKAVRAMRKYPPLKGKKRNRRKMKNLPFINYQGSNDAAKELKPISKQIIYQCSSRKTSTYLEQYLLFFHDAILNDDYLNDCIAGTFYKKDLAGVLD